MAKKRSTLRSSAGKKLYAKRDGAGKFEDIQSYKVAHTQDMKRTSKSEIVAKASSKPAITSTPAITNKSVAINKGKIVATKTSAAPKSIALAKTTVKKSTPMTKVVTKTASKPTIAAPKMMSAKTSPKKTVKK